MRNAEAVKRIIEAVDLPPYVVDQVVEVGEDASGDPAIWVWIIVADDATDRPEFFDESMAIEDRIFSALEQAGDERWPYVRFRTRSEQAEVTATSAA
jgi:hypothetical protein